MPYYPAFLRLEGRACLVVGGGKVAERKVAGLVAAGARVTVLSPTVTAGLAARIERGEVAHWPRRYGAGDVKGFFLVCVAAGDDTLDREIAAEAAAEGALVNVADRPDLCTFIVPARVRRGPLEIAVSTGGASPALAVRIRRDLEARFGPEYGEGLDILAALRRELAAVRVPAERRREIFARLAASPLFDYLREGRAGAVDALLREVAGSEYGLVRLGFDRGG